MPIKDIMVKNVVTADPNEPIESIIEKFYSKNIGCVIITENEKILGIITDRDIAIRGLGKSSKIPVKEIMTTKIVTATEEEGIFNLTKKFRNYGIRRIPIVDKSGELKGIISIDDILELLATEFANLAGAIRSL